MINKNKVFLQKHLDYIKNTSIDLEKYLIDNKVDFIAKRYIDFDCMRESFGKEEDNLFDSFLKTLNLLEKIAENAAFVLIKMLPGYEVVRSDIDILVLKPKDFYAATSILKENGFMKLTYPVFYRWQPANERFKQIWFHKDGKFLNIHLHRHIAWGSVPYISGNEVFSNLTKGEFFNKVFFIPNNEIYLRIIMLHAVFENFKLYLKDILEINELMEGNSRGFVDSGGLNAKWLNFASLLFDEAYSAPKENPVSMQFPVCFSRNRLIQLRLKKIIDDCIRHFSLGGIYFDMESYFFDSIKLFVMKPLRDSKLIK